MEGDLMLFKAAGYDFACLCLRSLLNIERADASASTSTRYVLRYSRTSDWNWCGSAVSGCTDSGIGLGARPLPEGLELLGGGPPAKAAPRDRTRRPGMRVGRCESLTAAERVVGMRPDMIETNQVENAEILMELY